MTPTQLLWGYIALLVGMVLLNAVLWLVIGALR